MLDANIINISYFTLSNVKRAIPTFPSWGGQENNPGNLKTEAPIRFQIIFYGCIQIKKFNDIISVDIFTIQILFSLLAAERGSSVCFSRNIRAVLFECDISCL